MINSLRLTPDAARSGGRDSVDRKNHARNARDRPWRTNSVVTKEYSWLLYKLYSELQDAASHTIPSQVLLVTVENHIEFKKRMHRLAEDANSHMDEIGLATSASLGITVIKITQHLTDKHFVSELQHHAGDAISLRALFCLCCPSVKEAEVDDGMRWCKMYRAHDVLEELLRYKSSPMVDASFDGCPQETLDLNVDEQDIRELFDAIDMDHTGQISMENLCKGGKLDADEAQRLVALWDRERTGQLSRSDLLAVVHQVHSSVRQQMKAMFADLKNKQAAGC